MKKILCKELKLAASPLSYLFIAGAFLSFVPGYPILLSAFFTTLGLFYSFQTMRENNDISYSMLLPVAKSDIVKGKYLFCVGVEACSFLIMSVITLIRMTVMKNADAYVSNALMTANLTFLGFALLIFGLFNAVFLGGFFKTAVYFGKPFILYGVLSLLVIFLAEALHHFPGLAGLNAFGFEEMRFQIVPFVLGLSAFAVLTLISLRNSIRKMEKIDL